MKDENQMKGGEKRKRKTSREKKIVKGRVNDFTKLSLIIKPS